jgi:hypothetical protein
VATIKTSTLPTWLSSRPQKFSDRRRELFGYRRDQFEPLSETAIMGFFSRIAENKSNKLIFTALAILLVDAAVILGMLCIFAGHQVDFMEDYHILTVGAL